MYRGDEELMYKRGLWGKRELWCEGGPSDMMGASDVKVEFAVMGLWYDRLLWSKGGPLKWCGDFNVKSGGSNVKMAVHIVQAQVPPDK